MDATVLGALQVDQQRQPRQLDHPRQDGAGNGRRDGPRGRRPEGDRRDGAHPEGRPEDPQECTLPLTALACVDLIVTEMGVLAFEDGSLILKEINPAFTVDEVRAATEADLVVADPLVDMV